MRKSANMLLFCFVMAATVWICGLVTDRQTLRRELVRFHVVGASDSESDQVMKLRLKDALAESLQADMEKLHSAEEAKAYLQENLPKIETFANRFLREAGCTDTATVTLALEEFTARVYDSFTLPAGLYETLRVAVGEGDGENWWCVVFPDLCLSATSGEFADVASCAGFSDALTAALEGEDGYVIRFWVLDALGRLENFLHRA